jgi:hypothetical protein
VSREVHAHRAARTAPRPSGEALRRASLSEFRFMSASGPQAGCDRAARRVASWRGSRPRRQCQRHARRARRQLRAAWPELSIGGGLLGKRCLAVPLAFEALPLPVAFKGRLPLGFFFGSAGLIKLGRFCRGGRHGWRRQRMQVCIGASFHESMGRRVRAAGHDSRRKYCGPNVALASS